MLDVRQQTLLLDYAVRCVQAAAEGREADAEPAPEPVFDEPAAVFVTLKEGESLRGCIGHIEAFQSLWTDVAEMAVAAALHDPRFRPVTPAELPGLGLDITVLSPLIPVTDVTEVEVGRDGLVIEKQGHRGVLLPQVPVEWGWNREQFLTQVARKAGLPGTAWQEPDARLLRFSGQILTRPPGAAFPQSPR